MNKKLLLSLMGTVALTLSMSSGWTQGFPPLPPPPPDPCDPIWGTDALIARNCPGTYTVFEQTLIRDTGKPKTENVGFMVPVVSEGIIKIINGPNGGKRISSAVIGLNGETIIESDKFNQHVDTIEMPVQLLKGNNTLSVKLDSKPSGSISIQITLQVPEPVATAPGYSTTITAISSSITKTAAVLAMTRSAGF